MDKIKSRVPGLSDDLPPRRNIWGDPIQIGHGLGEGFLGKVLPIAGNWLNPFYITTEKGEPIDEELLNLELPLRMPRKTVSETYRRQRISVTLTPTEYDLYIRRMNSVKFSDGSTLKRKLNKLVKSQEYNDPAADYETKVYYIKQYYQKAKAFALKEVKQLPSISDRMDVQRRRIDGKIKSKQ